MPSAPIPPNERERLDALYRTAILDTGPEEFFEDIVDMVRASVRAPIVLVSLVDEARQWFKARRGLEAAETTRDVAFCAHAILGDAALVVRDAPKDARFAANPLVTGAPNIRAYLGAPIRLSCGARLGTVCAIDDAARDWGAEHVAQLERAARLVGNYLDARRAYLEKDRHLFLEASLARVETRYQSVLAAMSEGMVVHGPTGAIIGFNAAACEILGLTADELFGRTSRDGRWRALREDGSDFPGESHPAMVSLLTGEPQYGVIMGIETPQGERRWISINSYPIIDEGKATPSQVVAVFARLPEAHALQAA